MSTAQVARAAVDATLRGARRPAASPPLGPWDYALPPGKAFTAEQSSLSAWIVGQFSSGKRLVTYSAPTGTGKSVLNLAVAAGMGPCAYVTPQKVLVDQLASDPLTAPHVAAVKGAGNYPCPEFGDCAVGRSARGKSAWEGERENKRNPGRCSRVSSGGCPYSAALATAQSSRVAVTTLHYWFFARAISGQDRPLLICDEAQDLEEVLAGLHRITVGGARDESARAAGFDSLPQTEAALGEWWPKYIAEMAAELSRVSEQEQQAADSYALHKDPLRLALLRDLHRRRLSIERRIHNASVMDDETENKNLPWCVDFRSSNGHNRAVVSPVTVQRFCRRYLLGEGNGNGRVALVSSATPPSRQDLDSTEDEYARRDVPRGFPPENRTVFAWPVASTAKRNRESGLKRAADAIDLLAKTRYSGWKGIVHCHAKSVMAGILQHLKTPRLVQRDGEREGSLEEWRKSTVPLFLSVAMEQGIDLPGDDCRWQVLPVVPFPDLSDKRVQQRKALPDGADWYLRRTANQIIQASGRNCRSASDWGHTWLLASEFKMVLNQKTSAPSAGIYPAWWLDAFRWLPVSWGPK